MYPQEFIDQVKNSTDIVKLAKRYTELNLVGDGIWNGRCPNPKHNDSDPSFTVWEKTQSWACLGCHNGKKGVEGNLGSDCFALVQFVDKISWMQALIKLAERAGIPVPDDKNQKAYDYKKRLAIAYSKSLNNQVFNYLQSRGLTRDDMEEWLLGFDGKRIVFPLFDRYRHILGFSKRWLVMPEGANDKYRNTSNSEIFNKTYYLYGIHNINVEFPEMRFTEGPMDVILSHKYGVKNIVATQGTSFTEGHMEVIKNYGMIPVFCNDGDPAGMKSTRKSIHMLAEKGIYSKILILPKEKDMADMANELQDGLEEYIVRNSMTYGQYIIQSIVNIYDAKVNEIRIKLYPEIIELLDQIPETDEKKIILSYIKDRLHITI
jgi:DNA primase